MEPRSFCKNNSTLYHLIITFLSIALIISHSAFPISVFRPLIHSLRHGFSWDALKILSIAAALLLGFLNAAWNEGHSNTHQQYSTILEDHATEEEEDFVNAANATSHDRLTQWQNVRQRSKMQSELEQHALHRPEKDQQRRQRSSEGSRWKTSDIHQQCYYCMNDSRRLARLRRGTKNSSHKGLSSRRLKRSTSLDWQDESPSEGRPLQRPIVRSGSTPTIYSQYPCYALEEAGYIHHLRAPTSAMLYNPDDEIERGLATFSRDGEDTYDEDEDEDEDEEDGLIFSPMSMESLDTSSDEISVKTPSPKKESAGKNMKSASIKISPPMAMFREQEAANSASAGSDSSVNKKAEIFIRRFREHIRLELSESFADRYK